MNNNFKKYIFKEKGYFYDEEKIYLLSQTIYKDKSQQFIDEQYNIMCIEEMETNVLIKLKKELKEFQYDVIPNIHEWFKYIPKEIYPNIVEWINDEDITDIEYKNLSIKQIITNMDLPNDIKENKYSVFIKIALNLFADFIKDLQNNNDIDIENIRRNYLTIASNVYILP